MKRALVVLSLVFGVGLGGGVGPGSGSVAAARTEAERARRIAELPELEFAETLGEEVYWVEGRLEARAIHAAFDGSLWIEGEWPGVPTGSLRLGAPSSSTGWAFKGPRGQRLLLRAARRGVVVAELHAPGQPVRRERWLASGPPSAELIVREREEGCVVDFELQGSPADVELAVFSDDPAFAELGGLVYLESLGRLALGQHRRVWGGRERSAAAQRVPPGRYRIVLRQRRFLPAPGAEASDLTLASVEALVASATSPQ